MEHKRTLVIDNGSGTIKAGISGENAPRWVFPSLVGRPRQNGDVLKEEFYFGKEAEEKRFALSVSHPIQKGVITNWDDMSKLWHHFFYKELGEEPSETPALLTQVPWNSQANREKITQIMFEEIYVPAFYLSNQAPLSLYSTGRTTGLVLDSGEDLTQVIPIKEGYHLPHSNIKSELAGRALTQYMSCLLIEIGQYLNPQIVRDIKEQVSYVALDFKAETASAKDQIAKQYVLPDGKKIFLGSQRFRCPEALFKPQLIGKETPGIQKDTFISIMKSDIDLRNEFYSNIVLSGGTTMLPGFAERLRKDVTALAPNSAKVQVHAPDNRKYSTWIGGSLLSSLGSFENMWITRAEYQETGASIVNKKCP